MTSAGHHLEAAESSDRWLTSVVRAEGRRAGLRPRRLERAPLVELPDDLLSAVNEPQPAMAALTQRPQPGLGPQPRGEPRPALDACSQYGAARHRRARHVLLRERRRGPVQAC